MAKCRLVHRGDIYWADLGSGEGSEQKGVRPVVIIQNEIGNKYSPTVIVACITSQINKAKLPTHGDLGETEGIKRSSIVLYEQIRTIDKRRLKDRVGCLSEEQMQEANRLLMISLGIIA